MRVLEERVRFPGATGQPLAARLERPSGAQPTAWALFAHCFSCSKDLKAVGWFSRCLVDRGFVEKTKADADVLISYDLGGRVVVLTGPTSGLGLAAARTLAHLGATLVLVGRDHDRTDAVRRVLPAPVEGAHEVVVADMGDLDAVRAAGERIRACFYLLLQKSRQRCQVGERVLVPGQIGRASCRERV